MTRAELENILSERFEGGCADHWGKLILDRELFDPVMDLAVQSARGIVPFRAAYALERAFLAAPERFEPYHGRFIHDYCTATHPSTWRHFGKIMALLLKRKKLTLSDEQLNRIAETAVLRLVDPSIAVGVRVWSLDILFYLKEKVDWIENEWPEIIGQLKIDPSPGMISRLRRFGWMGR